MSELRGPYVEDRRATPEPDVAATADTGTEPTPDAAPESAAESTAESTAESAAESAADSGEGRRALAGSYTDDPDDIFDTVPDRPTGRHSPDAGPGDHPANHSADDRLDDRTDDRTGEKADERADDRAEDEAEVDPLQGELSRLARDHPDAASAVGKLVADRGHPLDLTKSLADPLRRDGTLAVVRELAAGRLLGDGDLQDYREAFPGRGPLFEPVPREVNRTADGVSRRDVYLARCEDADPARRVGGLPDGRERELVEDYARRLFNDVRPAILAEVEDLTASLPDAAVSTRVKDADAILEKVGRMTSGTDARPPRDDYRVGDVVDAAGARITVEDTTQLAGLVEAVRERFGTGEGGRVLELDNMYANPKPANPSYRVIPVIVAIEAGGVPYTYELQLSTRRASVAADLEHNTIYKPYTAPTDAEATAVRRMLGEAAALDQDETRRAP